MSERKKNIDEFEENCIPGKSGKAEKSILDSRQDINIALKIAMIGVAYNRASNHDTEPEEEIKQLVKDYDDGIFPIKD